MSEMSRDPLVPESLQWLESEPGGSEWLERLPALIADSTRTWGLALGEPFPANMSFVAPAMTSSGAEVVLKVNYPHPESEHEAAAMRHWNGRGAAKLLDEDAGLRALLLERCRPGGRLWDEPESEATETMIEVFTMLCERPAPKGEFQSLAQAAGTWAVHLAGAFERAGGPFESELLAEALAFLATVRAPDPTDVVLHQDLHGGNVLKRGAGWVAIDPKPLAGEREFDVASYVRDRRADLETSCAAQSIVRTRIDRLSEGLGLDRERVRGWALAHALAWGFDADGTFYPGHVTAARLVKRC